QAGAWSTIAAIASRDLDRARAAAGELGIPRAYGSYDELLNDPDIEAIYNPLPNHLHVAWTIRAAEAGKHVLCEKPVGLDASEAAALIGARSRTGVKIQEAFMISAHPQWHGALKVIHAGGLGAVRSVMGYFGYFNRDPGNIRNRPEYGGGGLMDIGCYPILGARFAFGAEPLEVIGACEVDPTFGTDALTSAILRFPEGQAVFACSTQSVSYQRIQIIGSKGRIEIEIPFNAPPDRACRIFVDDGSVPGGAAAEMIAFPACDQYTLQGDAFSKSVREDTAPPFPLESSLANMAVIDAIRRSVRSGKWEKPIASQNAG
ncbi:MAG TPA: Gfo/Idh/MocA family oxidoreductase, partial [Terriglobia bacterium]|nr:Gfo/Idh/MocA family oxidoreductase [Terriglobia bacterium]